jgi:hypothetical protein
VNHQVDVRRHVAAFVVVMAIAIRGMMGRGVGVGVGLVIPQLGHQVADYGVVDADRLRVDEETDTGDGFGRGRRGGGVRTRARGGDGLGSDGREIIGQAPGDLPGGVDGVVFFERLGFSRM